MCLDYEPQKVNHLQKMNSFEFLMLILVNLYNPEFLLHISSPFVLECSFAHEKLKHVFRGKMVRQLVLRYVSHLAPDVLKQLILLRRNCQGGYL
ncbi:Uncharacterised protein [Streptococcus pneumoniae]|nr:Uncharacterised protein [Streptococcus pneumoniae]